MQNILFKDLYGSIAYVQPKVDYFKVISNLDKRCIEGRVIIFIIPHTNPLLSLG